jgi:hypothetical protein
MAQMPQYLCTQLLYFYKGLGEAERRPPPVSRQGEPRGPGADAQDRHHRGGVRLLPNRDHQASERGHSIKNPLSQQIYTGFSEQCFPTPCGDFSLI